MAISPFLGHASRGADLAEQSASLPGYAVWRRSAHRWTFKLMAQQSYAGQTITPVEIPGPHRVRELAAVDVRDFAGDLGIHSDSSAGVLDGQ
jgi:hypothetical protein